jgi:hypothetical protein
MGQNTLFEKLYGESKTRPDEEREEQPHTTFVIQSRQARSFLESLEESEA